MKCLNCGKETITPLCINCINEEALYKVFFSILFYNPEKCSTPYVIDYASSCQEKCEIRSIIPAMLEQFPSEISEFYYCIYYRKSKNICFEDCAIRYIDGHNFAEVKTQRVLYELLDSYLRNDFIKPQKWCAQISEATGLCAELYLIAAKHCAMIGEYDKADLLVDTGLRLCSDNTYSSYLFNTPEEMSKRFQKQKEDINCYRTVKPYWPQTEERRRAVAMLYDERGIKYPRIENKPVRIPEGDFEPIKECIIAPSDNYCTFWCAEAVGVFAVRSIYQIAAVKIRNGQPTEEFQSYVRPWDGIAVKKAAAKAAGVSLDVIESADDVDIVMKKFFMFVGDDVLMSTSAVGAQANLISRAARYAGMKKIKNEFFELLDFAAEKGRRFDYQNNNRAFLMEYFGIEDGKNSLEKARANYLLYNSLNSYGE